MQSHLKRIDQVGQATTRQRHLQHPGAGRGRGAPGRLLHRQVHGEGVPERHAGPGEDRPLQGGAPEGWGRPGPSPHQLPAPLTGLQAPPTGSRPRPPGSRPLPRAPGHARRLPARLGTFSQTAAPARAEVLNGGAESGTWDLQPKEAGQGCVPTKQRSLGRPRRGEEGLGPAGRTTPPDAGAALVSHGQFSPARLCWWGRGVVKDRSTTRGR